MKHTIALVLALMGCADCPEISGSYDLERVFVESTCGPLPEPNTLSAFEFPVTREGTNLDGRNNDWTRVSGDGCGSLEMRLDTPGIECPFGMGGSCLRSTTKSWVDVNGDGSRLEGETIDTYAMDDGSFECSLIYEDTWTKP